MIFEILHLAASAATVASFFHEVWLEHKHADDVGRWKRSTEASDKVKAESK